MSELCGGKKSAPIVLTSCDKLAKVVFYPSVRTLCLSVGARVKGSTNILLYACRFARCFNKVVVNLGSRSDMIRFGMRNQGKEMLEIEMRTFTCRPSIVLLQGRNFAALEHP